MKRVGIDRKEYGYQRNSHLCLRAVDILRTMTGKDFINSLENHVNQQDK